MKINNLLLIGAVAVAGYFLLIKKQEGTDSSPLGTNTGYGTQTIGNKGTNVTNADGSQGADNHESSVVYVNSIGQRTDIPNADTPLTQSQLPDFSKNPTLAQFVTKNQTLGTITQTATDPLIMNVQPSTGSSYQVWRPANNVTESNASQAANLAHVEAILKSGNYNSNI